MSETTYRICMSVPLGKRNGTMLLHRMGNTIDGWLDVLGRRNTLSGILSNDGQITLSGVFQTLLNTVSYTAAGTISGRKILLNLKTESGAYYPISGEELEPNDKVL